LTKFTVQKSPVTTVRNRIYSDHLTGCGTVATGPPSLHLLPMTPQRYIHPVLLLHMHPIVHRLDRAEVTVVALVRLGAGVPPFVASQRVVIAGAELALVARVGLFAGVLAHVHAQVGLPRGFEAADLADVRLQLGVDSLLYQVIES
jgi:hypothetical protein